MLQHNVRQLLVLYTAILTNVMGFVSSFLSLSTIKQVLDWLCDSVA